MTPRLLDAAAVADWLGVPKSFIYELARRGDIPCVVLGRYRRFRPEAIQMWIEEQEQGAPTAPSRPGARHHHQQGGRQDAVQQ
jgi:excisionase family DNA binding protein